MLSFAFFLAAQASAVDNPLTVADFDEATKVLRVAGLQFPGDGEYRTVTLELLTFRFGPSEIKLNGWIVVDEFTGKKSFLAWNGLTYDQFEVGSAASLERDLERGSAIVEAKTADFSAEYRAAMYPTSKIAALLLYSLGFEDRATTAARRVNFPRIKGGLVTEALQQFDQILTTRAALQIMYGGYERANLLTRSLRRFRNLLDEVFEAKGVATRTTRRTGLGRHWVVDAWLVDIRRRLVDARTPEMSLEEIARLPEDQQIAALVLRLDDSLGQYYYIRGQTPQPTLSPDRMLVSFGQAAVGALISHMNDTGMSLSMDLLFPMINHPTFPTTGSVAAKLVHAALGISPLPRKSRLYDLELIQQYWDSVRGLPREEQWLNALEFDGFSPQLWTSAARNLSIPPWVKISGAAQRSIVGFPDIEIDTPRHRWIELDQRAHDRVVRALENRIREILDEEKESTSTVRHAKSLAMAMAAWDLEAAAPIVKEILQLYMDKDLDMFGDTDACWLASILICSGDESGWDIYEILIDKYPRGSRSDYDKLFAPLWQHYGNPRAKQIAKRIFETEKGWTGKMLALRSASRLPNVAFLPEYRRGILAGFDDTEVALTATRFSDTIIRMAIPGGSSGSWLTNGEGTHVSVGGEFEVRWCDLLAHKLLRYNSRNGGFDLASPLQQRNAIIEELKEYLAQDEVNWSVFREEVRPRISSFDPVFATSLPPRSTISSRSVIDKTLAVAELAMRKKKR